MSSHDSIQKTLIVALSLCVVCSVVVSTAAVMLKPAQERNVQVDKKRNILAAAGMLEEGGDIDELFKGVTPRVVDLRTGNYSDAVDPDSYDPIAATKDRDLSRKLDGSADIAKIGRLEDYGVVYLVGDAQHPDKIVLPIRGAGLWGQMYGFLALQGDANTVAGIGFYEHKETPGLGGEIDNPRWKSQWGGKKVYLDGDVELALIKGTTDRDNPHYPYQIDGLSGATLTSRGVSALIEFWLGDGGYGPYLANLKAGDA